LQPRLSACGHDPPCAGWDDAKSAKAHFAAEGR
jgi:hypothetical protein